MYQSCYEVIPSRRNWKITTVPDKWRYPIQLYIIHGPSVVPRVNISLIPVHFHFLILKATQFDLDWPLWFCLNYESCFRPVIFHFIGYFVHSCKINSLWFNPFNHTMYVYKFKLILSKGFIKHEFTCEDSKDQTYFL